MLTSMNCYFALESPHCIQLNNSNHYLNQIKVSILQYFQIQGENPKCDIHTYGGSVKVGQIVYKVVNVLLLYFAFHTFSKVSIHNIYLL